MRIPLSWLNELIPLGTTNTTDLVHQAFVSVAFEEEDEHRYDVTGPVVVGQVLSQEPETHSNGKTVNWCQVRVAPEGETAADGGADVRGIVCGAHNFTVGDKVVVTLPGAVLPGGFAIAARKTYGHVSDGMIASQRELGLGDDHDGIIVLADLGLDAEVGTPAAPLLGLDDEAVEINVTPDRGYAFSLRGLAREFGHATGQRFADPVAELTARAEAANPHGFSVTLDDRAPIRGREGCTGFVTRLVEGVDQSRPTPQWMVSRLILAGQRPLGLAADISNYVMLELGNPLHAYDAQKLTGGLRVRRAEPGETLTTLDDAERTLDPEDLVIADDSGAIGLAGVMGGASTKTDSNTTAVLIEAATFDPVSIARTARRHKLPSEASKRFERGVDPLVAQAAAQRMVDLLVEYGGGSDTGVGSVAVAPWNPPTIELTDGFVSGLIGVDYSSENVIDALTMIGCDLTQGDSGTLRVTPPSWRHDLRRAVDLAEEVARLHGYDKIPSVLPVAPAGRGYTRTQKLVRRAADHITAVGFTEVQNYPFVSQAQLDAFTPGQEAVALVNPLDAKSPFLRRSLLPGLITCAQRNASRGMVDLSLVELGSVFEPVTQPAPETVPEVGVFPEEALREAMKQSIPRQPRHIAGVLVGQTVQNQPLQRAHAADWADAVDAVRQLAWAVAADIEIVQGEHPSFHPGRTARIVAGGDTVGVAGELLPQYVAEQHLHGRVAAFELNLDALLAHAAEVPQVAPLSTYPAATQDVTLLVNADIPAGAVQESLAEGCGELLEHIRLVADYRGESTGERERALTFALRFRASDRTLTAEEASAAKLAGVARAEECHGAYLRDDTAQNRVG